MGFQLAQCQLARARAEGVEIHERAAHRAAAEQGIPEDINRNVGRLGQRFRDLLREKILPAHIAQHR